MKYFNRFIKRLCYRISKRLIRLLIFFHLLSVFLVSSVYAQNIYEYKDMQQLAEGGTITTYIGNTPGVIGEVKYTIQDFQSFDDITITDDNTFKNCSIYITNSRNINANFNIGDVVYIRQKVVLNIDRYTNPTVSNAEDNFYITVSSVDSNGVSYLSSAVGSDIVDSVTWTSRHSYDEVVYFLNGFVRLPNINGTIESISYNFDSMSTGTVRVRIYPQSSTEKITYFVGQENNAPIYSSVDSSQVDNYHNEEDKILKEVFKQDPGGTFANMFKSVTIWFEELKLGNAFLALAFWINSLVGYKWISVFVFFGVVLGMFSFIFSVARDGVGGSSSKDDNDKNDYKGGSELAL